MAGGCERPPADRGGSPSSINAVVAVVVADPDSVSAVVVAVVAAAAVASKGTSSPCTTTSVSGAYKERCNSGDDGDDDGQEPRENIIIMNA